MSFPAFKEWRVIVEALGAGEQTIILRKGGIAENRGEFEVSAGRFWLFPTDFHAQREKTKPAAAKWFSNEPTTRPTVTLRFFADLILSRFVQDWTQVARLDPFHFWTQETVRERFEWGNQVGIHVLLARVHRLESPCEIPLGPAMGGCKSWIELDHPFGSATPVMEDIAFERVKAATTL